MTEPGAATDALIALFQGEGYARLEPPILQPADVFLDLSGEDIRRRMFVTADAAGRELCLRPEYTIPVCRHHLATRGGEPAAYGYAGPVFRLRADESGEFLQAGIESIGRSDAGAADAEIVALALEGLAVLRAGPLEISVGDMGLLDAVLEALRLPATARRRVMRAIVSGRGLDTVAGADTAPPGEHAGLLAAIEGQPPEAARALVEDVLAIAGITGVGGRSAAEIAERFLERAARRSGLVPGEARAVLDRYLAVRGDPDSAALAIRALAREAGLDLEGSIAALEERTGFMAARGLDVAAFTFRADFARNLDYYTGFIFEARAAGADRPVAGGGRYDRLLEHLGAERPTPAVGCALWLDRIPGAEASR
ncbi:MAG TPA: ATP phosphoribosyltransferase regulatory subunit [Salinarimonas sp.]|nr:ATP phosphoribosyltransferase regulatory subunit [Salinarimonas sp.]